MKLTKFPIENPGLVYISSGKVASTTSFNVTGFSANYNSYRLIITASCNSDLLVAVAHGASAFSNYTYSGSYYDYSGSSGTAWGAQNSGTFVMGAFDNDTVTTDFHKINTNNFTWSSFQYSEYFLGQVTSAGKSVNTGAVSYINVYDSGLVNNITGEWVLYAYTKNF